MEWPSSEFMLMALYFRRWRCCYILFEGLLMEIFDIKDLFLSIFFGIGISRSCYATFAFSQSMHLICFISLVIWRLRLLIVLLRWILIAFGRELFDDLRMYQKIVGKIIHPPNHLVNFWAGQHCWVINQCNETQFNLVVKISLNGY